MSTAKKYVSLWSTFSAEGDRIEVVEQGSIVQLRVNGVWQGEIDRALPRLVPTPYMQQMLLAPCFSLGVRRFLFIGLGAGCMPKALHAVFPRARIDVVEISPDIVAVAQRFFAFPPLPAESGANERHIHVHVQDGFEFIKNPPVKYDAIFIDAFIGAEVPAALRTRRTMWHLRKALAPQGVLTINLSRLDRRSFQDISANMERFIAPPAVFEPRNRERSDELNVVLMAPVVNDTARLRRRRLHYDNYAEILDMDVMSLVANRLD